jgi:nucleoside-diphosphate-sugar epimerase
MFQDYGKAHPKQCVTVVRVVPVIGPGAATSGLDVLFMPVTIHILGYDPPWQFMYGPDLVKLVVTLLRERRAGVFNAGAEGSVSYSEMRRATGKPSVGLPSWVWSLLIRFSWALRIQQKSAVGGLEFLKYPILVNGEKVLTTTGLELTYNSREAFQAFIEAKSRG